MTQWNEPKGGQYGQQPGYGAEPAGQPGGYGQPAGYAQQPNRPYNFQQSETFGIVGTVMALLAGVALVVAFTALDWFGGTDNGIGGSVSFGDLNDASDNAAFTGFAGAYFGWLAWVFLIVVVVAGVLASVPSPALRIFRIIGIVVGIAAAGLSFLALKYSDAGSYTEYIKHARAGFYLAVVAFIVGGIGAGIGPRKV